MVVLCAAIVIGGCSSSRSGSTGDEYFDPVRVAELKSDSAGISVPEFTAPTTAPGGTEPLLRQMMREQRRKMTELEQRLAAVETRQDVAEVDQVRRSDLSPAEEALLALIREQNLRLEEIMEQVRSMADRGVASVPAKSSGAVDRSRTRSSAKALYASAITAYRRGAYREAERLFGNALEGPIERSLADNCRFWLGVSRFQQKDLLGARAALEPVSRDGSSDKRTSAILMLGQVYDGLGWKDLARNSYERIVREFPRSSLRSVAERKLAVGRRPVM